jgi:hypothetical protein
MQHSEKKLHKSGAKNCSTQGQGQIPLVVWKDSVRDALGGWESLLLVVGYLIAVRMLGRFAIQVVDWSHAKEVQRRNRAVEARKSKKVA